MSDPASERLRPTLAAAPRPPWARTLAARARSRVVLKTFAITAFIGVFFAAYFALLHHPARAVTTMPLTALDHAVALQPALLPAYLSLWLYVGLPAGLMPDLRALARYGLAAGAMCAAGLACFYLWPTAVPAPPHAALAWLQRADAAGNACPSLHVATASFSALRLALVLREVRAPAALQALNATWFAAIAYSTLAVKQHVALDVAAGALLGLLFAAPALARARRAAP